MWIVTHASELDGKLIPHARLVELSPIEALNFGFAELMDGLDQKQRAYILATIEGRVGPSGGILVDDPDMPSDMQGREAPEWWGEGSHSLTRSEKFSTD